MGNSGPRIREGGLWSNNVSYKTIQNLPPLSLNAYQKVLIYLLITLSVFVVIKY
jgi:hypothetical protein